MIKERNMDKTNIKSLSGIRSDERRKESFTSPKIQSDFSMDRYGLHVRLVSKDDTDYILSLRTNKKLAKFLHPTENSRLKQLEWLTEYKIREKEGRDYYFVYEKDSKSIGVNRIYNIFEYYGTIGSWICNPENDVETSMATHFLLLDILFEILDLDLTVFDVRKKNKHVIKLHQKVGAQIVGESDINYYFVLNKQTYLSNRDKMLKLLNLK